MRSDAQYLLITSLIAMALAVLGTIKAFPPQSARDYDPAVTEAKIGVARGSGEITAIATALTALAENRIASLSHWRSTGLSYGLGLLVGLVVDGLLAWGLWRVLQTRWHLSGMLVILAICAVGSIAALAMLWRSDPGGELGAQLAPLLSLDPGQRETATSLLELSSRALLVETRQRYLMVGWFGALSVVFAAASVASALVYMHVRRNVSEGAGAIIERI